MQRLRPLSEAECYARCYGERDESVTLLGVGPHPLESAGAEPLDPRRAFAFEPAPETPGEHEWSGWAALVPLPQRPD
jgi:hypothetical protein